MPMTVHLMNAAVMPVPGMYRMREITPTEFAAAVWHAYEKRWLKSSIGYEQTAEHVRRLTGVPVDLSRERSEVESGDYMLIVRLPYRVADAASKGEKVQDEFEYFAARFQHYGATFEVPGLPNKTTEV